MNDNACLTGDSRFAILPGLDAAQYAQAFWDSCDRRVQHVMFHDVQEWKKRDFIVEAWSNATVVCLTRDGQGRFTGASWLLSIGGRCCTCHFCFCNGTGSVQDGLRFFREVQARHYYDSCLTFTPRPYRWALRYARDMGFHELGVVPSLLTFTWSPRPVDAVLMTKDLRE